MRLYLSDVGRHPLLSKQDEVRLAQVVEAGRGPHTELAARGEISRDRGASCAGSCERETPRW